MRARDAIKLRYGDKVVDIETGKSFFVIDTFEDRNLEYTVIIKCADKHSRYKFFTHRQVK